jgi:antitoxin HicB
MPIVVEPLPPEAGGGLIATVPDLPGCLSDGATPEQAVSNVQDAIVAWLGAARVSDTPFRNRRPALSRRAER